MNKKYIPSIELCKKLKEVGYPQVGEFFYITTKYREQELVNANDIDINFDNCFDKVVAPTADELLSKLPAIVCRKDDKVHSDDYYLQISKEGDQYRVYYINLDYSNDEYLYDYGELSMILCDALAKQYIYLATYKPDSYGRKLEFDFS